MRKIKVNILLLMILSASISGCIDRNTSNNSGENTWTTFTNGTDIIPQEHTGTWSRGQDGVWRYTITEEVKNETSELLEATK